MAGLVATGLVPWALSLERSVWLYDAHRLLAAALLVVLIGKPAIAAVSLRRRMRIPRVDRTILAGVAAALALAVSAGLGLAWTLGLVSFDSFAGYSALNVHVYVGLALGAAVLVHLALRWESPRLGRLVTRRNALRLLLAGLASVAVWRGVESLAGLTLGAARRLTGSRHAGSFSGNAFPYTSWLFDATPAIDAAAWRLEVAQHSRLTTLSYADLASLQQTELDAVLDCTGGWWSEQRWAGVRIGDVLAGRIDGTAREATVISVTGHRWTFPLNELGDAILATHVGGEPLDPGHGFPARLVVPGRRGFQWVKWVARIEVA